MYVYVQQLFYASVLQTQYKHKTLYSKTEKKYK